MICAIIYGRYLSSKIKQDKELKEKYAASLKQSLHDCELAKQDAEKKEIQMML